MAKKILLVYPEFPKTTFWGHHYALELFELFGLGKKAHSPPLGLITVAALLPQDEYEARMVDLNVAPLREKDLSWTDIVFTSSMKVQRPSLEDVIRKAKKFGKPVVAGGPDPTQFYEEMSGINHFVLGEAEGTPGIFELFLHDLEQGKAKKAYARPVIRTRPEEEAIDRNELERIVEFFGENADIAEAASKPPMSLSPSPRFDLLKLGSYATVNMQWSRGCPYHCAFCSEGFLYGHVHRLKGSAQVLAELNSLYSLGHRGSIFVVDDNLIGSMNVEEVLDAVKRFQEEKGYPFTFFTEASIDLAKRPRLMEKMSEAGFTMVFVGIENPEQAVLESMGKKHNLHTDLLAAVNKIQSYGMEVTAGYIMGNDNDPPDIHEKIFAFNTKAGIPTAMIGPLTSMKGSLLDARLRKEGRLLGESSGNNTDFRSNIKPLEGRSLEEAVGRYKKALQLHYASDGNAYADRCDTLLDNLGKRNVQTSFSHSIAKTLRNLPYYAYMLGNSLAKQSFSSYGDAYRKSLWHALTRHTALFPKAVALWALGNHYIKITEYALRAEEVQSEMVQKTESLKDRVFESLKSGVRSGEEYISSVMKEKDAFLSRARKRINHLPADYRPGLMDTYRRCNDTLSQAAKYLKTLPD